ncbi:hypothetical protein CC78DRAFT_528479 [Lojkania enalia]|uniref:DUF3752 domain-containing protein n=1 Tax=Lojkania enalia TaxID=147567 RepID=A0A9P4NCY6_9PLEO|nr:hypothetical protein CC78DRAFT_528479 [Didymosphaeria enalia]
MGPAPPPVPLSERPPNPPPDDSDSSSDEFGPAPPATGARYTYNNDEGPTPQSAFDAEPQYAEQANKVQRDDWMTMPPTQDDLAARMDPSKMRARKFNTGKSAGSGGRGGGMGIWTETPEQKLKRLQNEALGVSAPANSSESAHIDGRRSKEEERQARKIREKIDATRGKSLMEQHRENGSGKGKDDDPSKRGFDWEKDMGGGMKIGHKQRQEMLNKAKGFGDRFSSGSFL